MDSFQNDPNIEQERAQESPEPNAESNQPLSQLQGQISNLTLNIKIVEKLQKQTRKALTRLVQEIESLNPSDPNFPDLMTKYHENLAQLNLLRFQQESCKRDFHRLKRNKSEIAKQEKQAENVANPANMVHANASDPIAKPYVNAINML